MILIAAEFKKHTSLPVIIQSNAGLPIPKGGVLEYPETPEFTAEKIPDLIGTGVKIIGGCCGTTTGGCGSIVTGLAKASWTGPLANTSAPAGSSSAGSGGGCAPSCATAGRQVAKSSAPAAKVLPKC